MNDRPQPSKSANVRGLAGDVSAFWRASVASEGEPAPRSDAVESGRRRLAILSAVFLVAFGAVCWRLVELSLEAPEPSAQAAAEVTPAKRADIVDRNGVLLARDLIFFDISLNPKLLTDPVAAANGLHRLLPELDAEVLRRRFTSGKSFAYVLRRANPQQADAVHALGLPGVTYEKIPQRAYPQGSLFSHVIGYTGVDNRGMAGVELSREDLLRDGGVAERSLRLSLDTDVQFAARDVIDEGIRTYGASGGVGLVMDVQNGEILSLVSLPDFDPKHPYAPEDRRMFNRATTALYEMGSTFKTFTLAIGLDTGTLSLGERFDATHPFRIGGRTIEDYHPKNRWLTPEEVFVYSSNIGAAQIALEYGPAKQRNYMERFGMIEASPIELPGVGSPIVQRRWGPVETATIAYGYGLSVSPVQLASGVAALVNGGNYVAPTILKRASEEYPARRQVVSARTSRAIRELLRINVVEGTGKSADIPGYEVGGKTGTAKKQAGGNYANNGRVSSFVAVFPVGAPRYLVLVMLDEPTQVPDGNGIAPTGGATAAPLSGLIIRRIAPILGMPPNAQEVDAHEVKTKKS